MVSLCVCKNNKELGHDEMLIDLTEYKKMGIKKKK